MLERQQFLLLQLTLLNQQKMKHHLRFSLLAGQDALGSVPVGALQKQILLSLAQAL
jgi:hypothetical protein